MEALDDLFVQILRRGPSQGTLFLVLRKMKEDGRSSEVIQECLRALSIYQDDIRLRSLLAESYLENGYIEQAEAELGKVTSMIDDLSSAYKLQAKVYNQQQKPVAAFDALKTYIAHNPDDQEAQGLLAVVGPAKRAPSVEPIAEQLKAEPFERELQIEPVEEELGAEPFEEDLLEDALVQEKLVEGPIEEEVVELTEGEPAIEDPRGIEDLAPGAEEEREMFEGPSTPTIAEIYYDQGLVEEAITIYEQVLSDNPHDEASVKRLAELKAMIPGEEAVQIADADDLRGGKEKIIGILEAWRARILETGHA